MLCSMPASRLQRSWMFHGLAAVAVLVGCRGKPLPPGPPPAVAPQRVGGGVVLGKPPEAVTDVAWLARPDPPGAPFSFAAADDVTGSLKTRGELLIAQVPSPYVLAIESGAKRQSQLFDARPDAGSREVGTLSSHSAQLQTLSPDGRLFAASDGKQGAMVSVWALDTGRLAAQIVAAELSSGQPVHEVALLAFPQPGQLLLAANVTQGVDVAVWDLSPPQRLRAFTIPSGPGSASLVMRRRWRSARRRRTRPGRSYPIPRRRPYRVSPNCHWARTRACRSACGWLGQTPGGLPSSGSGRDWR